MFFLFFFFLMFGSGHYLIYGHGAFSECVHYGIPYCLQTIVYFNI
jgi:hypothetical protein